MKTGFVSSLLLFFSFYLTAQHPHASAGNQVYTGSENMTTLYTSAWAYVKCNGDWQSAKALTGQPIASVASNTNVVVYTTGWAYGYSQYDDNKNGRWSDQALTGKPIGAIASGNIIVVYTTGYIYVFCQENLSKQGKWNEYALTGQPQEPTISEGKVFISTSKHTYTFYSSTSNGGEWLVDGSKVSKPNTTTSVPSKSPSPNNQPIKQDPPSSTFATAIINEGSCGLGGSYDYLVNTDTKNNYRVTVRTFWNSGINSGQSDEVITIEAGGRVSLGCTSSGGTFVSSTTCIRKVVGESKI